MYVSMCVCVCVYVCMYVTCMYACMHACLVVIHELMAIVSYQLINIIVISNSSRSSKTV
jgi:hypothetical protein